MFIVLNEWQGADDELHLFALDGLGCFTIVLDMAREVGFNVGNHKDGVALLFTDNNLYFLPF